MKKDEITRDQLCGNIMRSLTIQIDYNLIGNIQTFINEVGKELYQEFGEYNKISENEIKIELKPDLNELQKNLSIPIKELETTIIHSFEKKDLDDNLVTLLISDYYMLLSVKCNNYKKIDDYLIKFADVFLKMKKKIDYINCKRFGLRKIGYDFYENVNEIFKDFEQKSFFILNNNFILNNEKILQSVKTEDEKYNINISKFIDGGEIFDELNKEIKKAYRVVLDLDGYFYFNNQEKKWDNQENIIREISVLNDYLFILFKDHVTEEFLKKFIKK